MNAACATDYQKLLHFLKDKNVEHTFTSSRVDKKPIKVVIRGLSVTTDPALLKEDLENLGYNVESVAQLKSLRKNKALLPLFLVSLVQDGDTILNVRARYRRTVSHPATPPAMLQMPAFRSRIA